jgi:hypothetical protein
MPANQQQNKQGLKNAELIGSDDVSNAGTINWQLMNQTEKAGNAAAFQLTGAGN